MELKKEASEISRNVQILPIKFCSQSNVIQIETTYYLSYCISAVDFSFTYREGLQPAQPLQNLCHPLPDVYGLQVTAALSGQEGSARLRVREEQEGPQ